jgi:hypothetical protein
VLTGRAPELAAFYPSAGGAWNRADADACWLVFRETVRTELPWIREWLNRPPQTNEVGRSNLLLTGLLRASRSTLLPVRLLEIGASAGLNLRSDHFRWSEPGLNWGEPGSPVDLAPAWDAAGPPAWLPEVVGRVPALDVVERLGCDLTPIDPLSAKGALALRAYVWADQRARFDRLDGALRLAAKVPAEVRMQDAGAFLAGIHPQPGTLTVVWHSIMRQYVPKQAWAAVDAELDRLAGESTPEAPFAYISFEPEDVGRPSGRPDFALRIREGDGVSTRLALAPPHGLPATAVAIG